MKKLIGSTVLMCCIVVSFLYWGERSEAAIPTNKNVRIEAYSTNFRYKGTIGVKKELGWDYMTLANKNFGMVLESIGADQYRIKANNPNSAKYNYWTISDRGYIYLHKKEQAQTFRITERSDGYCYILKNERPITTHWWNGDDYVIAGSNGSYSDILWKFENL